MIGVIVSTFLLGVCYTLPYIAFAVISFHGKKDYYEKRYGSFSENINIENFSGMIYPTLFFIKRLLFAIVMVNI